MEKKKRVVCDLDRHTYENLKELAKSNNRSISSMLVRLVALSTGLADPEPFAGTQVNMPTTAEDREAMLERIR